MRDNWKDVAEDNWATFKQLVKFVREAQLDQARDYITSCLVREEEHTQISAPPSVVPQASVEVVNGNTGQSST